MHLSPSCHLSHSLIQSERHKESQVAEHQRNTSAVIKTWAYIPRRTANQVPEINICLKSFRCQWSVDKLQHNCSSFISMKSSSCVIQSFSSPSRLPVFYSCRDVSVFKCLYIHFFSVLSVYCSSVASFCKSAVMKSCRSSVTHFKWWLLSSNEVMVCSHSAASKNRYIRFGFLTLKSSQSTFSCPRYKLCGVRVFAFTLYLNMNVISQHTFLSHCVFYYCNVIWILGLHYLET